MEVKDILSLRPKTNPSADRFQYHDTGSDMCVGSGLGRREKYVLEKR